MAISHIIRYTKDLSPKLANYLLVFFFFFFQTSFHGILLVNNFYNNQCNISLYILSLRLISITLYMWFNCIKYDFSCSYCNREVVKHEEVQGPCCDAFSRIVEGYTLDKGKSHMKGMKAEQMKAHLLTRDICVFYRLVQYLLSLILKSNFTQTYIYI